MWLGLMLVCFNSILVLSDILKLVTVEVAPIYDNAGETTTLAATEIINSLLTLMVQNPVLSSIPSDD